MGFYGTSNERQQLTAIHIIVLITFANIVMAKYTKKQNSYVFAIYKRFPPHALARSSQQLSGDKGCYSQYLDMEAEARMNSSVQSSKLAETELELRCLTQLQQSAYLT